MTIAEATKSMIDILPEADIEVIYAVAKKLLDKEPSPFKPLTKSQILADLAQSRQDAANGDVLDFDDAMMEIETTYGI